MTRTLDLRDALGDAPRAMASVHDSTFDLESALGTLPPRDQGRRPVRNVLLRSSGTGAPGWSARAALDTDHRALISMMFEALAVGGLDEEAVATRLLQRMPTLWTARDQAERAGGETESGASAEARAALVAEPGVRERVASIALEWFPPGSTIEWSDEVDEDGDGYHLMSVRTPVAAAEAHRAYLAFVGAWARAEPPEKRARIRVSCRPGAAG